MRGAQLRARTAIVVVSGLLLASLGGCSLGAPKLNLTDPVNIIYSTRLAIAQTNDTVATAVDTGVMSSQDGRQMQTRLSQAALALLLAEAAVDQGRASGDHIAAAQTLLSEVRKALQNHGVSPPSAGVPGGAVMANLENAPNGVTLTIVDSGGPMGSDGERGDPPAGGGEEVRL